MRNIDPYIESLKNEIADLKKKVPLTGDGVVISHGDTVYGHDEKGNIKGYQILLAPYNYGRFYSTPEALEKASGKSDEVPGPPDPPRPDNFTEVA